MNSWIARMRRGDFAAAWRISDAILQARASRPCWHLPRHEQYVWDGTSLEGARVLVRCYHGLGDSIQFVRYAPLLRSIAASVTFWVQPALIPLLSTIDGIEWLPLHDGTPQCEYDVDVEVMELPYVFRSTLDTLPATVPYLHVPPLDLNRLLPAASMRVGLFWRAGDWDDRRTIPASLVSILTPLKGIQFCMVQRDAMTLGACGDVHEVPYEDDLWGTARIMRGLDLVISADSMPAHLAGALGVPAWVLLHADADWRWMDNRVDSPWYPTLRLFRQQVGGEWRSVVEEVANALTERHTRFGNQI